MKKNKTKTYKIPVEWAVFDTIEVKANSFAEAVKYAKVNADNIPLGTEPYYIDGSWCINGDDETSSNEELVEHLINVGYGKGY